uniref:non-specific serine/threonine protein kinase n=1 Tax=Kalanchoe fedtschenkoi TaxID=63787 RepID=A0A7N0ZZR1_KALFE
MGNNCDGMTGAGANPNDGLIKTLSATYWRSGTNDEIVCSGEDRPECEPAVHNTPPEKMRIGEEEISSIQLTKHEEAPELVNQSAEEQEETEKEPVGVFKEEVQQATMVLAVEEARAVPAVRPQKPFNVKRMLSAGLEADSVLKMKTGHLKESYNLGNKIGHGQYGTTFLCTEKATGKQYACKSIAKRKLLTKDDVEDVEREIEIMHHLAGHPNVITIKGAYEDAVAVHVVMELCGGGELFDRILMRGHYTERNAAKLARTVLEVVEACHNLGIMHRDLKPENFLFVNDEEDSPLKAIDFGLSMFFKPGEIFSDVVGSPFYIAPEVLSKHYGAEVDIWSAGVIIYILLCGVPPFWAETEEDIFEEILHGNLDFSSDPWPCISDSAKDLVKKMLVRDPKYRISAREALCHPWVQIDGIAPDRPIDSAVLNRLKQFSVMNKLKKMVFRVIAESLSDEELAELKELFKLIDTDNSGQITLEELESGMKKLGFNLNASEIINLMRATDVNDSGTIDYGEFLAATLHTNKVDKDEHLLAAFSYFDKDGSGYITQDELQVACEGFGIEAVRLEEMIREVDQDNDGKIDYTEFVAMMQNKSNAGMGKNGLQDSFSIKYREALEAC